MFGATNPFGQSSSSPFGQSSNSPFGQSSSTPFGAQQSIFGQPSNASNNNNPFAPKPFGSTAAPFGSPQSGSSIFGGTSTGVFGAAQSSTPAFGTSSTPAFGASSTPAFGSSSSPFGGGFGSTPTQTSPFGSTGQPSQPAFGTGIFGASSPFGSSTPPSPFGATSTPAFGSATPAFGGTSTPAFGGTSTPAFGAPSTPAFGATTTPSFGSTPSPAFGSTGSAFGATTSSVFGTGSAFGASSTPAFGSSSTPAFGSSSTPAFGASSTPAFGTSTTPFGTSSSPSFSFGQSGSAFGSSPFGAQIGNQATTPTFGSPGFGQSAFGGQQRGGSRVTPYAVTAEQDSSGTQPAGKLESISAMPAYINKSHEELRWEDYQLGDKGGPNPSGQSSGANPFAAPASTPMPAFSGQTSPFSATTPSNPFSAATTPNLFSATSSNPFAPKPFSSGFASGPGTSLFGSTSSTATSVFGPSTTPAFAASTSSSLFATTGQSSFGTSPSIFSTTPGAPGMSSGFTSQSSPLFSSVTPSFPQTNPGFGQQPAPFGQGSTPAPAQANIFGTPSTGFSMGLFSSTPSLLNSTTAGGYSQTTPSFSSPFQQSQPPQTGSAFGFSNLAQPQPGSQNMFGLSNFGQSPANLSSAAVPTAPPSTSPFGTLPPMPQLSIDRGNIQYGISSMPVVNKPAPVRVSSLLTSRHLSQRMRLPARKYHAKDELRKDPFFSDQEEMPSTPKADALFIPRENPRALVIRPSENWPSRASAEKPSPVNEASARPDNGQHNGTSPPNGRSTVDKNQTSSEDGHLGELPSRAKATQKSNGVYEDQPQKDPYKTLTGHRAGEAAIVYEHGADIEALMPKLRHSDYYTEPKIQELAAKERAEPGFCRRVKGFVVGRYGFGSIKFIGETDVRRLDLESLIQFNNREVIVYMDDSKKPPVGQGLNKPAEVTLLNIKCFERKTGKQYTEGAKVEKYKEMLKKKAAEQGAEFVSYDPMKGEWKFRVGHF